MNKVHSKRHSSSRNVQILARARSTYNDIFLLQVGDLREMWFKGQGDSAFFLQTRTEVNRRLVPILVYTQMALAALWCRPPPQNTLNIGLGGGVLPNCLKACFPEAWIDNVEIDTKVIHLARKYFFLEETERVRTYAEDGRIFLERCAPARYDLVFLDAFKSGSVPFHLKTREFYQSIRRVMAPGGVLVSNLYGLSNTLKPSDVKTFAQVFPQLYFFEDADQVATLLVATLEKQRLTRETLEKTATGFQPPGVLHVSMPEIIKTLVKEPLSGLEARIFKDDFLPGQGRENIEKNNRDDATTVRSYPIKNIHSLAGEADGPLAGPA